MKKLLTVLLAIACMLSMFAMTACGDNSGDDEGTGTGTEKESATETETEKETETETETEKETETETETEEIVETNEVVDGIEIVDSSDPKIFYGGSWTVFTEDDHYASTNQCCWTPGSFAEFTFIGTGIELYSVAKPNYNALYISVDDIEGEEYYPVYAESVTPDTLVFSIYDLPHGVHTIWIEVPTDFYTVANDNSISIDYFKVIH